MLSVIGNSLFKVNFQNSDWSRGRKVLFLIVPEGKY